MVAAEGRKPGAWTLRFFPAIARIKLAPMKVRHGRVCEGVAVAMLGLLLGGCNGTVTADLATDPPADAAIKSVQVNLLGLEFRQDDGTTKTLEFRTGELVDLLGLRTGDPMRLFTNEDLPVGTYTGVRLRFDKNEDRNAVTTGGGEVPLVLADGAYATVDFSVKDQKTSQENLSLMLDLRQSLSFNKAKDEYTLAPLLRAVPTGDAARIEGAVSVVCPSVTPLVPVEAVYLFSGTNVKPDDLDGANAEPFATTTVVRSGTAGLLYSLRFLPAGDYTIAFTCNGNDDTLGVSDDLSFRNVANVRVGKGEVLQHNLN
jgi:hypothetical protein